MGGYIGARAGSLSTTTVANVQDVTATDTTPEVTIINNTHEDTDGGREGKVIFKGQQSGGEESTLAEIQASHDGTADDEKGDLIFRTNDGSDGASPTERLRLDSVGSLGLGTSIPASSSAGVYLTGGGATYSTSSTYRYDMVNAYFDTSASAWKYIGNGVATQIYQANGSFIFNYAANNSSGAGASLTWAEKFKVDDGGHASFTLGANAKGTFSDGVGEVGSGNFCLQVSNDAGSALKPLGFRGEDIRFATGSAERARIDSNGKFMVGKTAANAAVQGFETGAGNVGAYSTITSGNTWHVHDTSSYKFYVNSNGGIYNYSGNNVNLSDEREKKNIETLDDKWNAVKAWTLKKFHYNSDEDSDSKRFGVIAQDLETDYPELISEYQKTDNETRKAVKEQQMMWMAIKALQEAMAKIETLETKVAALEAE